jgi:hypothetical protein
MKKWGFFEKMVRGPPLVENLGRHSAEHGRPKNQPRSMLAYISRPDFFGHFFFFKNDNSHFWHFLDDDGVYGIGMLL